MDRCPWPRCREEGDSRYMGLALCERHWQHLMESDTSVGHSFWASFQKDQNYVDGCRCSHCMEHNMALKVLVENTETGQVTILVPENKSNDAVQEPLPPKVQLADISYPRHFRYTALVDGKHKTCERAVSERVTLHNFKDIFGPERERFRLTPEQRAEQKAGRLTREEALAQWILENSENVSIS